MAGRTCGRGAGRVRVVTRQHTLGWLPRLRIRPGGARFAPVHLLPELDIRPDAVHVWAVSLDSHSDPLPGEDSLSDDERHRADCFRNPEHRRRFLAGRRSLRRLLSAYTGCPPDGIRFAIGKHGRPHLEGPAARSGLDFNLSHSGDEMLIALARRPVGVDVESRANLPDDFRALARDWFAPGEVRDLAKLASWDRGDAFLAAWTRKEAVSKALGLGLALPPDRIDVTLRPGRRARLRALDGDRRVHRVWDLHHLEPRRGYIGALAISGGPARVVARRLAPSMVSGSASIAGVRA